MEPPNLAHPIIAQDEIRVPTNALRTNLVIPGEKKFGYPNGITLRPHELVGCRFETEEGNEVIVTFVENNPDPDDPNRFIPRVDIVEDFTRAKPDRTPLMAAVGNEWRDGLMLDHLYANLPLCKKTLHDLPKVDVAYVVGSGPALMRNHRHLEKIDKKNSVIIGMNELLQYLPAGLLDYYLILDVASPAVWYEGRDVTNTTAVLCVTAPPHFAFEPWKDLRWFRLSGHGPLVDDMREAAPHLDELSIGGYSVSFDAIEFAYKLGAKTVVFVGMNYCHEMIDGVIYDHINEPLTEAWWEGRLRGIGHVMVRDIHGKPAFTEYSMLRSAMTTMGAVQCLIGAGVRVINASEGGILRPNPRCYEITQTKLFETKTLEETVEELNG